MEVKRGSQSKGGKGNLVSVPSLPSVEINNPEHVITLLVSTINEVRSGQINVKVANCIGYLSNHLLKAYEVTELEKRIQKLESQL